MDRLVTDGISVLFDPVCGVIDEVVFACEGGEDLRPLHKAPWTRAGERPPPSVPAIEQRLAGDFFCAPFAKARPDLPLHGWAANGDWQQVKAPSNMPGTQTAIYQLRQKVEGAALTKQICVRSGHPFVYQTHIFTGGAGEIPIAHHAMLHVPGGARLSFSPKSEGRTGPIPPETEPVKGRSILAYPQTFTSLASLRRADSAIIDGSFYPFDRNHEDVVVLSECPTASIGWSAAVADQDGFVFLGLKDASLLPQTVIWMSNGGRYYPPWNGRHTAVIGIEEAAVDFHLADNGKDGKSVRTALTLAPDTVTRIRYAFGAFRVPRGWSRVSDVAVSDHHVVITDAGGDARTFPFDGRFLLPS